MNSLGKLFLKGLAVVIPAVLTVAILWWMATGSEHLLGGLLTRIMPAGWYIPGLGLASAIVLIVLVGLLSHILILQKLFEFWEAVVNRLPLVKTIYTAIKDFMAYFSQGDQGRFSKVVLVTIPGQSFQMLGFVTRENFDDIPINPDLQDPVAVYMPMSYQIGGYTLYLSRSCLTPVNIPFQDAMRLAVTGGVTQLNDKGHDN
ncbi:MAG: putative membrane protein [Lysobacterales bacterium]